MKVGPGWVHFHLLIWKHLITQLTKISTENAKLSIPDIWKLAWRDFAAKVEAKAEGLRERLRKAESQGKEPPDVSSSSKLTEPIARFSANANILWDEDITREIGILANAE